MSENTPPIIVNSKVLVLTLIIAYGESASFCKNLAVKVIDALRHRLKNVLHHRARFFEYIGNPQLVGQSVELSHPMLVIPLHYLNLQEK